MINPICPKCGSVMVKAISDYMLEPFWRCVNQKCKYAKYPERERYPPDQVYLDDYNRYDDGEK